MAQQGKPDGTTIGEVKLSVNIDIASPEVRTLIGKARDARTADEAEGWSRAALNVANAQRVFMDVAFPRDVEATGFGDENKSGA